jgi:hypothetical protein
MDGEKINIAPDYAAVLFSSYPQISIYEALSRDGFTPSEIGRMRIRRLEEMFSKCHSAGTVPYESRANNSLLDSEEVAAALKNPFVESATASAIYMREEFHTAAAVLKEMPADHVLDIFMLGHRNFTLSEKIRIKELYHHRYVSQ